MALALILRGGARSTALQRKLTGEAFNSKKFTTLLGNANKGALAVTANKMQLAGLVKRNMSGDHSKLWPIEKAFSLALVGLTPATFLAPSLVFDNLFAIVSVLHLHWGVEACVIDYVRPIIFGSLIPKLALGLLYLVSAATLGGLLYYNHNSLGIGKTVRKVWDIKSVETPAQKE